MFHIASIQITLRLEMWMTEVKLPADLPQFNHEDSIVLMGSCFSSEIGGKLERALFKVNTNEFGTIFHPYPICRAIMRAVEGYVYSEEDLILAQGKWHSVDHQNHVSHENQVEALSLMNGCSKQLRKDLAEARLLILTLGTSWGYKYKSKDLIVANCHRVPQTKFSKELARKEDLVVELNKLGDMLCQFNPHLEVLYTVSPVRHWKDGGIENSNSKSELIAAVNEVVRTREMTHYFPSYEILVDELRDYRFYKDDMLHPSGLAVNHVWDRFQRSMMNEQVILLNATLMKLARIFDHKDDSEEHLKETQRIKAIMSQKLAEFYGTKKG